MSSTGIPSRRFFPSSGARASCSWVTRGHVRTFSRAFVTRSTASFVTRPVTSGPSLTAGEGGAGGRASACPQRLDHEAAIGPGRHAHHLVKALLKRRRFEPPERAVDRVWLDAFALRSLEAPAYGISGR
jgi:hypothetical protein